jgi:hypothetical protein
MALRVSVWSLCLAAVVAACSNTSSSSSSSSGGGDPGFCSLDGDCNSGARCRGGVCTPAECATNPDCLSPLVCVDGECIIHNNTTGQCAVTADCPMPYLCDGFSRRCFNPDTGMFLGGSSSGGGASSGPVSSSSAASGSSSSSSSSSSSTGGTVNLGGYRIDNEESGGGTLLIPAGTTVPRGGTLVIARFASRREFEQHWGVTLPTNVTFLNADNPAGVPVINGGEKFSLWNGSQRKDGPTVAGSQAKTYRRTSSGSAATLGNWTVDPETGATPGVSNLPVGSTGVFISEWADASGSGNYIYEFVEIYVNP